MIFFSTSSVVSACQVGWRSAADLKQEASIVVKAEIVSLVSKKETLRGKLYTYRISVESVVKGVLGKNDIHVRYEDLKPHVRDGVRVCPLKNGSDIEHSLLPRKRYVLYLNSQHPHELLLATLKNEVLKTETVVN